MAMQMVPVPTSVDGNATATAAAESGSIAKHVVRPLINVDGWDILLILGWISLIAGLWLTLGLGVALFGGGATLIAASLLGARSKASPIGDDQVGG